MKWVARLINSALCWPTKCKQSLKTGKKLFIMLDRWNKLSHDSSILPFRIFTLSHHTKDICNPLQCKHDTKRRIWMLENKPIYPPREKTKQKAAAFSQQLFCTITGSFCEPFQTRFHRWTTNKSCSCCDSAAELEPWRGKQKTNHHHDCLWYILFKECDLKT